MRHNLNTSFLMAEKTHDMFHLTYNGFEIWPFLRFEMFRIVESLSEGFLYRPVYERQLPVNEEVFFSDTPAEARHCDFLVVTNRHRMVTVCNETVCPVTYMFREIGYSTHTLYHSYQKKDAYDADGRFDGTPYGSNAASVFSAQTDIKTMRKLKSFCRELIPDDLVDRAVSEAQNMIGYVSYMSRLMPLFDRILDAYSSKILFVSSAYAIANMFLIYTANKRRIPTVEIQHGLIGESHVAYNTLSDHIPQVYYPDHLMVYGEFDKMTPRHLIPRRNIHVIGNKLLEVFCQIDREDKNGVLIIGNISNNDHLTCLASTIKKQCPSEKVTYRVHAEETDNAVALNCLEQNGVIISKDVRVSVYQLLLEHKWVIGTVSTVLQEALRFKINTVVLDEPSLSERYGFAQKQIRMMTRDVLIDHIRNDRFITNEASASYDFYAPFSSKTVEAVINSIMRKSPI